MTAGLPRGTPAGRRRSCCRCSPRRASSCGWNIDGTTRVNSAFAYVDPVRDRLIVAGDALVDRVLVRDGRAVGVAVRDGQQLAVIRASRVVLSAGAYGSLAILLRSGIGPSGELAAIGVRPALDLPGVGRNLHDQPCVEVRYEGSGELTRAVTTVHGSPRASSACAR